MFLFVFLLGASYVHKKYLTRRNHQNREALYAAVSPHSALFLKLWCNNFFLPANYGANAIRKCWALPSSPRIPHYYFSVGFARPNLKPWACEDIYFNPVASEPSGGCILNSNQLLNTNRPQINNQLLWKLKKLVENLLHFCRAHAPAPVDWTEAKPEPETWKTLGMKNLLLLSFSSTLNPTFPFRTLTSYKLQYY